MAIRSLAPEIIVCDEIGSKKDIESLEEAFNCGVNIIVTIHGFGIEDIFNRYVFKKLLDNRIIERVITFNNKKSIESVCEVKKGGIECISLL